MADQEHSLPDEATSIDDAIDALKAVKAEHRGILEAVSLDPGMTPETRWTLIEHLYEEEEEHLERMSALVRSEPAPAGAAAPASSPPAGPDATGRLRLTVGSLRPEELDFGGPGGSVGSMRRRHII